MMYNSVEELALAINAGTVNSKDISDNFNQFVINVKNENYTSESAQAIAFLNLYQAIKLEKRAEFLSNPAVNAFFSNNLAAKYGVLAADERSRSEQALSKVVALESNPKLNNGNREFLAGIIRGSAEVSINSSSAAGPMTGEAFKLLSEELPASKITALKIQLPFWSEEPNSGSQNMLSALVENRSIKNLDLSNNAITSQSAGIIANIISSPYNGNLNTLDLSNTRVCEKEGASTIARGLRHSKSLQTLNLRGAKMSDEGAVQLAVAFQLDDEDKVNIAEQTKKANTINADYSNAVIIFQRGEPKIPAKPKEEPRQPSSSAAENEREEYTKAYLKFNTENENYAKAVRELKDYNKIKDKYGVDVTGKLKAPKTYDSNPQLNVTVKELNLSNNTLTDKGAAVLLKSLENNPALRLINLSNTKISDKSLPAIKSLLEKNKNLTINLQATLLADKDITELTNQFGDRINPSAAQAPVENEKSSARALVDEIFLYNPTMKTIQACLIHGDSGRPSRYQSESREVFLQSLLQSNEYKALPDVFKTMMIDEAISAFNDWSPPSVKNLSDPRLLSQMSLNQFESVVTNKDVVFGKQLGDGRETEALLDTKCINNMNRAQIYLLFNHINTPENRARLEALPRKNPLGANDDSKRGTTRWAEVIEAMKDRVFDCTLQGTSDNKQLKATNLIALAKDPAAQKLMGTHATEGWHILKTDSYNKLQLSGNVLKQGDEAVDYAMHRAARISPGMKNV